MGTYTILMLIKSGLMCYFMNVCDQKSKRVETAIDRDAVLACRWIKPIVAIFTLPVRRNLQIKVQLLPQSKAIVDRQRRQVPFECRSMLIVFQLFLSEIDFDRNTLKIEMPPQLVE